MTRCSRCGLSIRTATPICPGCGERLGASDEALAKNYYVLFELSPQMSQAQLSVGLREAARVWTNRANSAPQIEQRHHAELMLQYLTEVEAILLNPSNRSLYDEALRDQQKKDNFDATQFPSSRKRESHHVPLVVCPRCGLRTNVISQFCPACGFEFHDPTIAGTYEQTANSEIDLSGVDGNHTVVPAPTSAFPKSPAAGYEEPPATKKQSFPDLLAFFGWRKRTLTGTVISIDPIYMANRNTYSLILKIAIWLLLLPIILGMIFTVMLISLSFSMVNYGKGNRPGFFSNFANQMFQYIQMRKMFGPKEEVPVRDVRLRDSFSQEHLVRIKGELIAGNMNVGDEVQVEGYDQRGTLMLDRGWNKRLNAEIRVRRR